MDDIEESESLGLRTELVASGIHRLQIGIKVG
jgi:hypothetical protein